MSFGDGFEIRNEEAQPGTAPIKREDLETWAQQFEAPDAAELALFDEAHLRGSTRSADISRE